MNRKIYKTTEFTGIIPPLMTPFDQDGNVDEAKLRNYIEWMLPYVGGFYPLGTYGCGPMMTLDQRKKAAEIIVDQVRGRAKVIIHVGCTDTASSVELAKHAESIGADAVGAIAPYYYPLKEEELFQHFKAIKDSVSIPLFAYNNPAISKQNMSPALIRRLADDGLRGLKDSSFDLVSFYRFREAVKDYPDFNVIIGTEAILNAAFQYGATGAVTGLANVYPELLHDLYQANVDKDIQKANELQAKVLRLRDITKYGQTVPTMHAILRMRGIDAGYPRKPYLPISKETEEKVRRALKENGLL